MDITPEINDVHIDTLSYDQSVPYDEQLPLESSVEPGRAQLADRIGNTKVYLLSEATGARLGKRKHGDEDRSEKTDGDVEMEEDSSYRENAILFRGTPISHLPTPSIFAYATHFDSHPLGLEWVDDTTCILVFSSKADARAAYRHLAKSIAEEPSNEDGSVTAKPIPIALWPPEDRINKSLGKSEGLKGAIRMRWATMQDVKKKGAKKESEFYKKYGEKAGKNITSGEGPQVERDDERHMKRRRGNPLDETVQKAQLDDELDAFLAEDNDASREPTPPPSKMRSDYIGTNGKSLLERTSVMRARPDTLASRIMAELPRRARSHRDGKRDSEPRMSERRPRKERYTSEDDENPVAARIQERPRKTQKDLDDELDAFLRERE